VQDQAVIGNYEFGRSKEKSLECSSTHKRNDALRKVLCGQFGARFWSERRL
jgi:hypothetical protein